MSSYALVLPPPWVRIHLQEPDRMRESVRAYVEARARRAPKEIPPDQLAALKVKLQGQLVRQLEESRDGGTIDYYLPSGPLHGVDLNASFVVSSLIPDANADAAQASAVHTLLGAEGATAVVIAGTHWSRSEAVVTTEGDQLVEAGLPARRITYTTAVPGDERRWALVTCTVIGDGNPDSDHTQLVVELFDAIMTTWRWDPAAPKRGSAPSATAVEATS